MTLLYMLFDPFFCGFMYRALLACLALSISAAPLGVFLSLRRMSLVGDALSHSVLPGVAMGYLFFGMSLTAMGVGGFIAGLIVSILSGLVSRYTSLKEDASFSAFYLFSLALGVMLVSIRGSNTDLLHVLFGSILVINNNSIIAISIMAIFSLLTLIMLYRIFIIESFDSTFLQVNRPRCLILIHGIFLVLVVTNLVAGFQILGTLMSIGLMMLPANSARFWGRNLPHILIISMGIGILSSLIGLECFYYTSLPAGPAIVLSASMIFFISVLFGKHRSIYSRIRR
ncbi:Manganese transport system membrane protein MntB [Candidatus Ecksteinia adelgidicola]|nr:Manganese transport system membrane protein MntB [Candidatus Ecksteinia adelgidicola]